MALAAALAAKRGGLRRTEPAAGAGGGSGSGGGLGADVAAEKERHRRLRACDLEAWYEPLVEHTFRTTLVSLSPEEAKALVARYWAKKKKKEEDEQEANVALLAGLEARIAAGMKELEAQCTTGTTTPFGVFAKLSSRSPKDSTLCEGRALAMVKAELEPLVAAATSSADGGEATSTPGRDDDDEQLDANTVFKSVMRCGIQALELRSAADVVEAFVTSDRVCEDDLPLALEHAASWSQNIVLREWVPIPTHLEFRGFVVGGKLTALSQYFSGAMFADLVAEEAQVLEQIQTAFVEVRKILSFMDPEDYMVDFGLQPSSGRVFVIELNPFGPPDGMGTGTPLFNLKDDGDRAVLFGEAPFEFRIQREPAPSVKGILRDGPLKEWLTEKKVLDSLL